MSAPNRNAGLRLCPICLEPHDGIVRRRGDTLPLDVLQRAPVVHVLSTRERWGSWAAAFLHFPPAELSCHIIGPHDRCVPS